MPARREVIRPEWDPVIVRLDKGPEGVQREGQYGVDYQYVVNSDSGIMWLPKSGRDALLACGAQAGDEVEICKSKRGAATVYFAQRVSDAHEAGMVGQLKRSLAAANAPGPVPVVAQAQPPRPEATDVHPMAQQLAGCMRVAIDAVVEARDYARSKKLELDGVTWEDVRAVALSVYIAQTKAGR